MNDSKENFGGHKSGEATPQDINEKIAPETEFGLHDSAWSEEQWLSLLKLFVSQGIADWRELASLVLGHLNPSQVGTSLASSTGFKRKYGKGNTMRVVMDWAYSQHGRCEDCGSRLELQADHIEGREQYGDPLDADFIENMTLRCRRCNVVRRPSHNLGGQTFLTAESALMWILLVIKPRTLIDFIRLCRIYGMTMADIRMQEAWAMAHWLAKADPPLFGIEDEDVGSYDILLWANNALTRVNSGDSCPEEAKVIYSNVSGVSDLAFIVEMEDTRSKLFVYPVAFLPFSSYELGELQLNALAIRYSAPDRANGGAQQLKPLAPINLTLKSHSLVTAGQKLLLTITTKDGRVKAVNAPSANHNGKLLEAKIQGLKIELRAE
jgi:hypothetical protein